MEILKNRYWTFLVYLDSAPVDWVDRLECSYLKVCISPLHDRDIDKDGNFKKSHYHVLLAFDGPTTYKNALRVASDTCNAEYIMVANSLSGIYDYFTHKNNPEKAQYLESDIINLNGFDIYKLRDLTPLEESIYLQSIISLIRSQSIKNFAHLIEYLTDEELFDFLNIVKRNNSFFNNYVKGRAKNIEE